MKIRKSFTIDKKLLEEISEFRWVNRINSLSEALEYVLRIGLTSIRSTGIVREEDEVKYERKINNEAYLQLKNKMDAYRGKYIVIVRGEMIGVFKNYMDAVKTLLDKAPNAKHAIITKVGRKIEVDREWAGLLEKLK